MPTQQKTARVASGDRKEAIIEAAIKVFATGGYHRVTTADISREAGISQPYIYRFFDTKEELFREAVERIYARIEGEFEKIDAEQGDLIETLIVSYEQLMDKFPYEIRLQVQTLGIPEEFVQKIVKSSYLRLQESVAAKFQRAGLENSELQARDFLARGMLCNVAFVLGSEELTYVRRGPSQK